MYDRYGVTMNSLLAVPIRSGAKVLGVMLMVNRGNNEVFTDRDKTSVEVSSLFTSQANISTFCQKVQIMDTGSRLQLLQFNLHLFRRKTKLLSQTMNSGVDLADNAGGSGTLFALNGEVG